MLPETIPDIMFPLLAYVMSDTFLIKVIVPLILIYAGLKPRRVNSLHLIILKSLLNKVYISIFTKYKV